MSVVERTAMEIHTCKNCEIVDETVSKKVLWFEVLSVENLSLHGALAFAHDQNHGLLKELNALRAVSVDDHNQIVKLFLENENRKLPPKDAAGSAPRAEEIKIRKLLSLIECQKKIYEEEVGIILNEKEVLLREFEKQKTKLHDHVKILLEELELSRQYLFRQTKENLIEKHLFRNVVNELKMENKKVLEQISRESVNISYDKLKAKMENIIMSKNEQLKKQDELINMLQQQQEAVNMQAEDTVKNKNTLIDQFQTKVLKVRDDYKKLQHKYYNLERRRRLDAEGFHTDVKLLRNDLKKMGKVNMAKETVNMYDKKLQDLGNNVTYLYKN